MTKLYGVSTVTGKFDTIGIFEYESQEAIDKDTEAVFFSTNDKFKAREHADKLCDRYGYALQLLPWKWDKVVNAGGKFVKLENK